MTFEDGAKFTDADITPELRAQATTFLANYTGTFAFLVDLQSRSPKNLSTGQIRATLNCMLADAKRNEPKPPVAAVDVSQATVYLNNAAAAGLKYPKVRLLDADGNGFVIRLKGAKSAHPGAVEVVSAWSVWNERFQSSVPLWYGRIDPDGAVTPGKGWAKVEDMIRRFAEDPLTVAKEYGKLTGNCCFCGRQLTDERSTEAGYGPVCAVKYGLEWGHTTEDAA